MSEFKNTTVIHRTIKNKDNSYTCISNRLINDLEISCEARMIMIYLLSKPDNWIINQGAVQTSLGLSRGKCRSAFGELITSGYIIRNLIRDSNGRIGGYDYVLNEVKSGDSSEMNRKTENRQSVTGHILNTNINKYLSDQISSTDTDVKYINISRVTDIINSNDDYKSRNVEMTKYLSSIIKKHITKDWFLELLSIYRTNSDITTLAKRLDTFVSTRINSDTDPSVLPSATEDTTSPITLADGTVIYPIISRIDFKALPEGLKYPFYRKDKEDADKFILNSRVLSGFHEANIDKVSFQPALKYFNIEIGEDGFETYSLRRV